MKRKLLTPLVLVAFITLTITAFAKDGAFNFNFTNLTQEYANSSNGIRSKANGKDWQVRITGGNLDAYNILGMRPRAGAAKTSPSLGNYQLYTKLGTANRTYAVTVNNGDPVFVRAKKDNTSTKADPLMASGGYTP